MNDQSAPAANGPKVTVTDDTPSAQLVRNAIQAERLECDDGRALHVRKPSVLAGFQITEAAGPIAAENERWMRMVNPLIYLGGIETNGEVRPVPMPQSKDQIESLILELGEPGMDALLLWYMINVITPMQAAMDGALAERNALKNG